MDLKEYLKNKFKGELNEFYSFQIEYERKYSPAFNILQSLGWPKKQSNKYRNSMTENQISNLIASLLLPKGQHGQKVLFLHNFLNLLSDEISKVTEGPTLPQHHKHKKIISALVSAGDSVIIEREFKIQGVNKNGFADIIIKAGTAIIGIENKIYAPDQPDQLKRYWDSFSGNRFLVYLSANPHKLIAEQSFGDTNSKKEIVANLHRLDYEFLSIWIESSIKSIDNIILTSQLKATVGLFKSYLNKETTPHLNAIKRQLLQNTVLNIAPFMSDGSFIKFSNLGPQVSNIFIDWLWFRYSQIFDELEIYIKKKSPKVEIYNDAHNQSVSWFKLSINNGWDEALISFEYSISSIDDILRNIIPLRLGIFFWGDIKPKYTKIDSRKYLTQKGVNMKYWLVEYQRDENNMYSLILKDWFEYFQLRDPKKNITYLIENKEIRVKVIQEIGDAMLDLMSYIEEEGWYL